MPIFTSLLFFFLALAFLPLAFRGSSARQDRRKQAKLDDRMETGADICRAAAREAFGVELDRSLASIAVLDDLIERGWRNRDPETDAPKTNDDLSFIFAAYLGTVLARFAHAEWGWDREKPALFFHGSKEPVPLFPLVERKLQDPEHTNLSLETMQWYSPTSVYPDPNEHGNE